MDVDREMTIKRLEAKIEELENINREIRGMLIECQKVQLAELRSYNAQHLRVSYMKGDTL